MASLNKAILIGHLGKDSEVWSTPSGRHKLSFTLATNRSYKDKAGEWKEEVDWHNVVAWGEHFAAKKELLTRGKQVYVEGRIQLRKYQTREGEERSVTEVNVWRMFLLGKASGGSADTRFPVEGGDRQDLDAGGDELDAPF